MSVVSTVGASLVCDVLGVWFLAPAKTVFDSDEVVPLESVVASCDSGADGVTVINIISLCSGSILVYVV